jgi:DNA-binding NarL/FixJ family response regulator
MERTKPRTERTKQNIISLYTVEEEKIYHDISRAVLQSKVPIELLGVLSSRNIGVLRQTVSKLAPDVLLMSIKKLEADIIKELEKIRTDYPKIGIVLLLEFCSAQDIELLRRLAVKGVGGGTALFLKQTLGRIERLCMAIPAVSQGQFILDLPLATFMFAGKPGHPFLKQLTHRELEILNLLAEGYTNLAIAKTLYIEPKTVERHLNSIYGKLKADGEFTDKHVRVSVAKLYLETIGDLGWQKSLAVRSSVKRR